MRSAKCEMNVRKRCYTAFCGCLFLSNIKPINIVFVVAFREVFIIAGSQMQLPYGIIAFPSFRTSHFSFRIKQIRGDKMLYMILKDGFEETEAIATLDFIKRADIEIKTVSDKETVTGTHGVKVGVDILFSEIETDNLSGVILPGGQPGSDNLFSCDKTKEILEYAYKEKKLLSAICAAPYILGERGYLKGKDATCFPGFESHLKGANVVDKKVTTDGNVITAKGMGASFLFGYEIVKYFKGEEASKKIMEAIFY